MEANNNGAALAQVEQPERQEQAEQHGSPRTLAVRRLVNLVEKRKEALARVAPTGYDVARMRTQLAMVLSNAEDSLLQADEQSVVLAVFQAVELGLDLSPSLGQAYLVAYGGWAQLIIGYQGWISLLVRERVATKIEARLVFARDEFVVDYGTSPRITHRPTPIGTSRGQLVGAYAVAWLANSEAPQFEIMDLAQLEHVAKKSRSPARRTDPEEMHRKAPIRRLAKYLAKSGVERLERALAIDNEDGEVETTKSERSAAASEAQAAVEAVVAEARRELPAPSPVAPVKFEAPAAAEPGPAGGHYAKHVKAADDSFAAEAAAGMDAQAQERQRGEEARAAATRKVDPRRNKRTPESLAGEAA